MECEYEIIYSDLPYNGNEKITILTNIEIAGLRKVTTLLQNAF